MSDVKGIVVSHGDMAEGIVDAVRQITGIDRNALVAVSNRGLSPETLIEELRSRLEAGQPTIVFTDLQSGSCAVAARRLAQQLPGTAVISGANLPLLLEFSMSRSMPIEDLVNRLVERGRMSIVSAVSPEPAGAKKP